MLRLALIMSVSALLGTLGCAAIDVPEGYIKLRNPQPYDLKAVSAQGNVIALTVRPNEDAAANLKFWSQAVEYQKVTLDGMKLAAREDIKAKNGLEGVLFNLESGEGQGRYTYLLALYVTPRNIYTVEAGGPRRRPRQRHRQTPHRRHVPTLTVYPKVAHT
jgi:hypothetical protein